MTTTIYAKGDSTGDSCVILTSNRVGVQCGPGLFPEGYFGAQLNCQVDSFSLTVFDRWGHSVFQTASTEELWNARKVDDGAYYFLIIGVYRTGNSFEKKGIVNVIFGSR